MLDRLGGRERPSRLGSPPAGLPGVGYIGNPVTWVEVEQLRVAIITCKAYTALSLGHYIPAQHYAQESVPSVRYIRYRTTSFGLLRFINPS